MVNFGLNAAAILGLFLAVAGAGLFFLRSIRPELARDYDIFFAAVGLLCGIILLFNGWRLDPILQFGQFLLTGTAIFFAFESIRMRGVATEQARRNTTTVDRDRPVSRTRVYTEAELDKIDPYDNVYEGAKPNYSNPRLRGYDEPQPRPNRRPSTRNRPTTADVRDEPRPRPRPRPSRSRPEPRDYTTRAPQQNVEDPRYGYDERNSRPRRRPAPPTVDSYDEWDDTPRSAPRPRPPIEERYAPSADPAQSRRRPSPADLGRSYEPDEYESNDLSADYDSDLGKTYDEPSESIPGDYVVDYQPLEDLGTDYDDEDYDDSDPEYEDYDREEKDIDSNSDYDEYENRSERRKPINFNNDY